MPRLVFIVTLLLALLPGTATATRQAPATGQDTSADLAVLQDEVIAFLEKQASSYPGSAQVRTDAPRLPRGAAPCDAWQVSLPGSQQLRSRMSVSVRCVAPQAWSTRVQAHLVIDGFFYVANRIIEPGETLTLDDVAAREGDILALPRGVVIDPSKLIDRVATQRIPRGTPIKAATLRSPLSVQRGQQVRTEARGAGFIATGEGQSLEDGAPGEQIRVRTPSGQVISATVLDANTVMVAM